MNLQPNTPAASNPSPRFMTTRWTMVLNAGSDGPERDLAMEQFCQTYWYPVYAFIRRRGIEPEDARDSTQSFFAKLIARDWLEGLERRDSRFSTWLLTLVKTHLMKEHARDFAQKRGGEREIISFDLAQAEDWFGNEPAANDTPERAFERRWALAVLDSAMTHLREDCMITGKSALFEALSPFLSRDPAEGEYAALSKTLSIRENSVAVAVHRLRAQYRKMVRDEVAAGLRDPALIEEELRHLAASL